MQFEPLTGERQPAYERVSGLCVRPTGSSLSHLRHLSCKDLRQLLAQNQSSCREPPWANSFGQMNSKWLETFEAAFCARFLP
jgi:hypothetical protein